MIQSIAFSSFSAVHPSFGGSHFSMSAPHVSEPAHTYSVPEHVVTPVHVPYVARTSSPAPGAVAAEPNPLGAVILVAILFAIILLPVLFLKIFGR